MHATFQVFADYHQFYLMDAGIEPAIPDDVTEDHIRSRVRTAPHVAVFYTETAAHVPVEIAIVGEPSAPDWAWDHCTDFDLSLPSGTVVLCGCTDYVPDSPHISVNASEYLGRAFFSDSVSGSERYRIVLWPSMAQPSNPAGA